MKLVHPINGLAIFELYWL